ncbi:gamma-glutamyltransferase family protein [Hyphomonas sp. FCG-A18]|nr:gamma-glutamyltransferase family protein [Hyphomonas sp. FCG-A18]
MRALTTFLASALTLSLSAGIATAQSTEPAAPKISKPGPGDRMPSGRDIGTRSAVVAPNAAAATAHPLATQVALDIMKDGGSAMDAAIAANAMLGLVEPTGNGIGGDLFAIVWDPETQQLYGYNGSGRSPMGATLADMQAAADEHEDGEEIPPFGAAPVSVPGTVDGWFALHEKFGRLPMQDNLTPTIEYARNGAPIPEVIAYYWGRNETRLAEAYESGMLEEYANAKATYFSPAPREGSLFRNPDLANTLEAIATEGRDAFYKGELARTMDAYMERIGGFMSYEDLAAHEGEWIEPICVTYRAEVSLCELGPNTQGVAALQMLQMLERFDLRDMGFGSADSLMAQVEAKRLAFADRAAGYADPAFSGIDPTTFVRPGYNEERGRAIDISQAMEPPAPGFAKADKKLEDGDTTYLTVTDKDGMMVSLIQSNYRGMGSGLVPDGLGFMLQDRGQLFSLDPEHPNVFEPGKRPFHTIIPAFAFKADLGTCDPWIQDFYIMSGEMPTWNNTELPARSLKQCEFKPWLSFGLMGGGMQPQGHVQIILNLVDYNMGLQEAGDAARWEHRGGCEPTDNLSGDECESDMGVIWLESGIPEETRAELERRGHTVKCCQANGGGYQAIMRDFETGAWIAATEMRKDGNASGY